MTALTWTPKPVEIPGAELEYVGPYGLVTVRKMPLITLTADWYEDLRVVARNGRRRNLNRSLLGVLWRTGLRVSEALDLLPHHVDQATKRVTVLHGKGDRRRTVGIDDYGLYVLQPWLFERAMLNIDPRAPRRSGAGQSGRTRGTCGSRGPATAWCRTALAGVPKRVHPHGFRHTMACDLVQEGFGINHVQAQLGHSNVATTAGYLRGMGADEAFDKVAARPMPGGAR